jgi:preprotein translocase subunit Sss1
MPIFYHRWRKDDQEPAFLLYHFSMNKTFFTTITPFSKLVALGILVIGPFAGFYTGMRYQKSLELPQSKMDALITKETTPSQRVVGKQGVSPGSIEEQFIESKYRVLKVLKNPDSPSYLIIATERSKADCGSPEEPSRCVNDTGCGGMYYSLTCYFFEEPDFVYGADPNTRFVGKYEGYSVDLGSFEFGDDNKVEFSAGFGDAGYGVITKNSLDLSTGKTTELSKEETTSEME